MRSLSSWRAWIEMRILLSTCKRRPSRSPHGERGLKYRRVLAGVFAMLSLSSWRAWIEMCLTSTHCSSSSRSPHGERGLK